MKPDVIFHHQLYQRLLEDVLMLGRKSQYKDYSVVTYHFINDSCRQDTRFATSLHKSLAQSSV